MNKFNKKEVVWCFLLPLLLTFGLLLLASIANAQQCGPSGCRPATSRPSVSTEKPHPAIVKIISTRGPYKRHGTGTFLAERGNDSEGLVLTCAHILSSGFEITVIFPSGMKSRAEILAIDALYDCSLLSVIYPGGIKGLPLASVYPQRGERLTWAGYGPGTGYATGKAIVQGYRGDWLITQGQARQGDSGGPLYNNRGIAGILCEMQQEPDRPWQIRGPQVLWIRRFIDRCKRKSLPLVPIEKPAQPAVQPPVKWQLPSTPPGPSIDYSKLVEMILVKINLEDFRGPAGPVGPAGETGLQGRPGLQGRNGLMGPQGPTEVLDVDDVLELINGRINDITERLHERIKGSIRIKVQPISKP